MEDTNQNPKPNKPFYKRKRFYLIIILLIFLALGIFYAKSFQETLEDPEKIKTSSLLFASAVLGFLDGFNPCAMWVLIYLITLVSTLKDKKKLYVIVGTFVITEAIMYFFVLAGWLTLFNFIGFSRYLMFGIGAFAILFGLKSLQDFIKQKGQMVCKVTDFKKRQETMSRMQKLVHSPLTWVTILGIIALAVTVNSFEFACSWQLVSVFTQMLSVADISTASKYFYILVYDFFFMLDDFIIFALAAMAIDTPIMDKYAGLSKLLGGIIMIALGIILLFFPNLLI